MSKAKEALGRIRDLPANELVQAADRARDELFRLKLSSYTNQVQDTASVRNKRRELARILTVIGGRDKGVENQASKPALATAATRTKKAPAATKAPAAKKTSAAKKTAKQKED